MKRIFFYLLLVAGFLTLTAESCLLSEKEVEVPVRDSENMEFHTQGTLENTGTEIIDFKESLLDLEADNEFDHLLAANIENAWWRVKMNNGSGGLSAQGFVTVEKLNSKPGVTGVAVGPKILSYQTQSIDAALGTFQPVVLDSAGVSLMNQAFQDFLVYRAENPGDEEGLPSVKFQFDWNATISGGDEVEVDFTWEGKIKFSLVGVVIVDVPEL